LENCRAIYAGLVIHEVAEADGKDRRIDKLAGIAAAREVVASPADQRAA
jgi:hypothetical protein